MPREPEIDFKTLVVFTLAHTVVIWCVGYYFGRVAGVHQGECLAICDEATAGTGYGAVNSGVCECTVIGEDGQPTTWIEKSESGY